jgi:hypothetical protein
MCVNDESFVARNPVEESRDWVRRVAGVVFDIENLGIKCAEHWVEVKTQQVSTTRHWYRFTRPIGDLREVCHEMESDLGSKSR